MKTIAVVNQKSLLVRTVVNWPSMTTVAQTMASAPSHEVMSCTYASSTSVKLSSCCVLPKISCLSVTRARLDSLTASSRALDKAAELDRLPVQKPYPQMIVRYIERDAERYRESKEGKWNTCMPFRNRHSMDVYIYTCTRMG